MGLSKSFDEGSTPSAPANLFLSFPCNVKVAWRTVNALVWVRVLPSEPIYQVRDVIVASSTVTRFESERNRST